MTSSYSGQRRLLLRRFKPAFEIAEFKEPLPRWLFWLALSGYFLVFLLQQPGREVFDTKLDLIVNPTGLLKSLWYLWDPLRYFGVLQDQYQGYAWPMGPFFYVFKQIGTPAWITQRLWMALVESLAFWSMIRLEEALEIGNRSTRLLTGLMFSLWPTFTMLVGSTSGAILPGILIPAVTTPLVKAAKGAPPLKSAITSAAAVACMGGINATVTLEGLILPVMFLLTRKLNPRLKTLAKWWAISLCAAISWWLIPLLFLGHYGFNFLPYIETAKTTTSTMSATEVLRGAGYWTGYLDFGYLPKSDYLVLSGGGNPNPTLDFAKPWIPAGWIIATNPLAIIAGCLLAAISIFGLARRDMPERTWLIFSFGLGFVFATAGYWGSFGGVFSPYVLKELDSTFAPLRNVYKVEPEMAVCLCLGFCHSSSIIENSLRVLWNPKWIIRRQQAISFATFALIIPLSLPYLTGNILQGGSFKSIPSYWYSLAKYLDQISPYNPVLIVPAQDQGVFTWGTTVDEPLEPIAVSPWTALNQVPFSGAGARRFLNFVENQFTSGNPIPDLSSFLERAGITYIVADNDTDWRQAASPSPAKVHQVLSETGYVKVAGFGPLLPSQDYLTLAGQGSLGLSPPKYQALEVFAPANLLNQALPFYPVTDFSLKSAVVISGGPGSVGNLVSQGLISPSNPVILSAQVPPYLKLNHSLLVTTNGLELRHTNFGLLNLNTSYVLKNGEPAPLDSPGGQGGNPPKQILPFVADSHQTFATFTGIKNVTASSYGSWYYTLPQFAPFNAILPNSLEPWVTGNLGSPVGQWIKITFNKPKYLNLIYIKFAVGDIPNRPYPTILTVTTQNGSLPNQVDPVNSYQPLLVPKGKTTYVKITISKVKNLSYPSPGVSVESIKIPGVNPERFLTLPSDFYTNSYQAVSISADPANPGYSIGLDYPLINSIFKLVKPESFLVTAQALPIPSNNIIALTDTNGPIKITASSTFQNLPMLAPINLLNPDHSGFWMANSTRADLFLSWNTPVTFNQISFIFSPHFASYPKQIAIITPEGTQVVSVNSQGLAEFNPVTTNKVEIQILKVHKEIGINQLTGYQQVLPVGFKAIDINGLTQLETQTYNTNQLISLGCNQGPEIKIDNQIFQSSVVGTLASLLNSSPFIVRFCPNEIHLSSKKHTIKEINNSEFRISAINLIPIGYPVDLYSSFEIPKPFRAINVINWGAENRSVEIAPGPASILEIHEDANIGWVATLNGQSLKPITVDGFQQGFIIPAGQGGLIVINYYPNFLYRLTFGGALIALVILLTFALSELLFNRPRKVHEESLENIQRRSEPHKHVFFLFSVLATFISGGILFVSTLIVSYLGWRALAKNKYNTIPLISAGTLVLAGVIAAITPGLNASQAIGSFSPFAQILALFSVSALLTAEVNWPGPVLALFAPVVYRYRKIRHKQKRSRE